MTPPLETIDKRLQNRRWLLALLLVAATFLAYQPVWHAGFVWDDDSWTTQLLVLHRSFTGLRLMWTQLTLLQQYYPLSGTSFWVDYHLWRFWALPYHVENVVLHTAAAWLFWNLLRRLHVPGAWLAGALFALHPIMVESVAWVTERKNVLSLVLYLGALLAYGRFTGFWNEEQATTARTSGPSRRLIYVVALVLLTASLLAKTTAFSIPAVILLICWWKRGRIRWREDVVPVLPFFTVSLALGLPTAWLEKHQVGALGSEWAFTFAQRCLVAGRAFWFYLGKLIWPANLCFVYPRWQLDVGSWTQWLYPITAVGVLLTLWFARARIGRGPITAALFYAGTLFPVLGFMNAYFMRFSFVCDHWTYLSSLGPIALVAALVVRTAERYRVSLLVDGFVVVVLPVLAILTWSQVHIYHDIETLWRDTLMKNPNAWMAHNNLGLALQERGNNAEAQEHYQVALRLKPDYPEAYYNLGNVFRDQGRLREAIDQYQQALRFKPDFSGAHNNWGYVLLQTGRTDEAIGHFQQALQIDPQSAEAHYNLGLALVSAGKIPDAIAEWNLALQINPDYAEPHNSLGCALAQLGRMPAAIRHWELALQINPGFADVHFNFGYALEQMGRTTEAIAHYQAALRLNPNMTKAHSRLAQLQASH